MIARINGGNSEVQFTLNHPISSEKPLFLPLQIRSSAPGRNLDRRPLNDLEPCRIERCQADWVTGVSLPKLPFVIREIAAFQGSQNGLDLRCTHRIGRLVGPFLTTGATTHESDHIGR